MQTPRQKRRAIPFLLFLFLLCGTHSTSHIGSETEAELDICSLINLENKLRCCSMTSIILKDRDNENSSSFQICGESETSGISLLRVNDISDMDPSSLILGLPQRRSPCSITIINLPPTFNSEDGNRFYTAILKKLRQDENYFIFMLSKSFNKDLLVSSAIGSKLKYKLYIDPYNDGGLSTTCLYCDGGSPGMVELNPAGGSSLFPDYTTNFHGKTMRTAIPPGGRVVSEIVQLPNGTWVMNRGIYKFLQEELMLRFNFTSSYSPPIGDMGTGRKLANGSWVGTVGSILYGTAELAHSTGQIYSRNSFVGFTIPVTYEGLTFFTGTPRPYYTWKAVLWPLSGGVWIGMGVFFILGNITMFYLVKKTGENLSFTSVVSYTIATTLEQDVPSAEGVKATPLRLFSCFWLFFVLIISTAYRAKLVSLLSFPNVEQPPRTFEALAHTKPKDYKIGLFYIGGAAYMYLKTSKNPVFQKIVERMELEEVDVKCFGRTMEKRYACVSWNSVGQYSFRRNLSDAYGRVGIERSDATTLFLWTSIVTELKAAFLQSFNNFIIHATDGNILRRWYEDDLQFVFKARRDWEKESGQPGRTVEAEDTATLKNKHLTGAYLILGLGSFIALSTFTGEMIYRCRRSFGKWKNRDKVKEFVD